MKTVIMAGGKGTRISSVCNDIPKPMIKIGGKPVIEHQIECLEKQGFTDLIITVSHLGQSIIEYFGDGSKHGVTIEYYFEEQPLGNAGALFKIKEKLTKDFLLLNADLIFDVNLNRFAKFHDEHGGLATLFTHSNSHPNDSGLIITDSNGSVKEWLTKEDIRPKYYCNRVNAGLHIISHQLLEQDILTDKIDLDRQLLKPLAGTEKMFAYYSPEYVKDMGTPERYQTVCSDYRNGIISPKNLRNKQRAIFIDRDGTINKHVPFLHNIDDFELLPNVGKAIKLINNSRFLVIVVTNQPVIARGDLTYSELDMIHNKMETLLGLEGAYLDAIYFCPHHPDGGFKGEIPDLKFDCDCRKPKPGMLLKAVRDFNIDIYKSWMIGDSYRDMLAGQAAGCRCLHIGETTSKYVSLLSAVKYVMENDHDDAKY